MRGSVKTDEEEEETEGGSLGEMADVVGKKPVMTATELTGIDTLPKMTCRCNLVEDSKANLLVGF